MKIKGLYGEEFTASEWAERLGVKVDLIFLCLQRGKSIADIHVLLKKPYEPPKTRKPREGKQMRETKERMAVLLEVSGFTDRNNYEDIEVSWTGTGPRHKVAYKGMPLGTYNYKTGGLQLSGGEGVPLWALDWEDAKIIQDETGLFHPHKDTRLMVVNLAIKTE